jgi:2-succinyl-5-enolpyruvyl-6-hydroxy-3-cyclohexene-1-carboxylate synthase
MSASSPATDFSVALLAEFIRHGVRDVVLSPGSRSQAIALAAAEFEAAGLIRLRVRIDERVAGFLALGIAVETGVPVLVVTTSGTAVANLHPAALEAHHSGVPLILLTADRPPELRGIGSNQTTDQPGMLGSAIPWVRDVEAPSDTGFDADYLAELVSEAFSAASGHSSAPGPVQLNLAFREPLSGQVGALPKVEAHAVAARNPVPYPIEAAAGTIVIAGHGAGERAESIARALGAPLVAEVSSGAHFGPNLIVAYRQLLRDEEFAGRVERVLIFGHPTLTREVPALAQREGVETIVVRGPSAVDYNPGRRVRRFVDELEVVGPPDADRSWLGSWVMASRALLEAEPAPQQKTSQQTANQQTPNQPSHQQTPAEMAIAQLEVFRAPVTRRMLADAVWRVTWPHDRLILGASRLIREVDSVVPGKRIRVHSNRGLAGIDGTVSTGIGIALASQSDGAAAAGTTRVLLGDLAVLHDAGALLFGVGEDRPNLQVIVANDGGGTIFDGLEVAASARREAFDRVLLTPQSVDLRSLAAAYGWEYLLASNRGELDEALSSAGGPLLIEVPLPRA